MFRNERGEAVLALMALFGITAIGMAHEVRSVEKKGKAEVYRVKREAAESLHYQKYHSKSLEEEAELRRRLEEARAFRIKY